MVELDYQIEKPYSLDDGSSSFRLGGVRYIIWSLIFVGPILIAVLSARHRLVVALFAYVNCLLYAAFAFYFAKRRTLGALIPIVAPLWLVVGSCVGIIYFSIFYPDGTYPTLALDVSYFAGGIRYQLVIFLFLLVYFSSLVWLLKGDRMVPQHSSMVSKYVGYSSIVIVVPVVILHALTLVANLPSFIEGWGFRLYNYYQSLLFVIGVLISRLSKTFIIFLCIFLGATCLFYSLGNARQFVLFPIAALTCSIFFFSELKGRTRAIIMAAAIFSIPWLLLITNTTRALLGIGAGTFEDPRYTWKLLKEWRYLVERESVGASFFGRMFFTAGNVIVAYSPSTYPYRYFSAGEYAKEVAIAVLPGPVLRRMGFIMFRQTLRLDYTGTWILRDYDINVSETTSVEVSTIGNLWMLGGYIPVLIGGFLLALIHAFVAWRVRRAWIQNPDKGIFYFSVLFFCILWCFNWDLINIWRNVVWHFIFAYFGFKLISPLLKIGYASEAVQYEEAMLEGYQL